MRALRRGLLILTAGCLWGAQDLLAQSGRVVWHPDSVHNQQKNAFPWGSDGVRYQTIIPSSRIGRAPSRVQDILVAGVGQATEIQYQDIEIRMGATAQLHPTDDWNKNNPNPTRLYRGPMRIRFETTKWLGIGLPNSYIFKPTTARPHLCIEIIIWKALIPKHSSTNFYYPQSDSKVSRAYLYQWAQGGGWSNTRKPKNTTNSGTKLGVVLEAGNFVTVGHGCTNSANKAELRILAFGVPTEGSLYTVFLTGGKPGSIALLAQAFTLKSLGPSGLPLDLGLVGAPRCALWQFPVFVQGTTTDPRLGIAKVTFNLPRGLSGVRAFMSWWNLDPRANRFGITTSNYATMIIGR